MTNKQSTLAMQLLPVFGAFVRTVEETWAEALKRFGKPKARWVRVVLDIEAPRIEIANHLDTAHNAIQRRCKRSLEQNRHCRAIIAAIESLVKEGALETQFGSREFDADELLGFLVRHVRPQFDATGVIPQSHDAITASLDHLLRILSPGPLAVSVVVPLANLIVHGEPPSITEGVVLRPLAQDEKEQLIADYSPNIAFPDPPFSVTGLARCHWVLAMTRECKRDSAVPIPDLLSHVQTTLGAFRLLRNARLGALVVLIDAGLGGRSVHLPVEISVAPGGSQFETSTDDECQLHELLAGLSGADAKSFCLALRWLNRARSARLEEDILLSAAIALEAALLPGIHSELSYRLAQRGAAVLRIDEDPAYIFDVLRLLYEARSALVHEGKSLDEQHRLARRFGALSGASMRALPSLSLRLANRIVRQLVVDARRQEVGLRQHLEELEMGALRGFTSGTGDGS